MEDWTVHVVVEEYDNDVRSHRELRESTHEKNPIELELKALEDLTMR
jgi:hypothetical protein